MGQPVGVSTSRSGGVFTSELRNREFVQQEQDRWSRHRDDAVAGTPCEQLHQAERSWCEIESGLSVLHPNRQWAYCIPRVT